MIECTSFGLGSGESGRMGDDAEIGTGIGGGGVLEEGVEDPLLRFGCMNGSWTTAMSPCLPGIVVQLTPWLASRGGWMTG